MHDDDQDGSDWQRQLLIGVIVLVAVGALIGGIVAVISIKAADLAGIDNTQSTETREDRPRMSESLSPTDSTESSTPSGPTTSSATGPSGGATSGGQSSSEPPETGITLEASPSAVGTYEQINLSGTYEAPDGTTLQIQRKEGGQWADFPVTATVNGGRFATYIETGQAGANRLRVLAIGRDEFSNTVTVQVG